MAVNSTLIERLQKILALTNSPVEGEAQAAAAMLQDLLTKYNLDIADLEQKGHQAKPGVKQDSHDLGKAAFTWKLDLAEAIADHFYCHPMVSRTDKTVSFVGRPDNVESLKMLYAWIIEQIRRIASDERKSYQASTGEHIDPLRWQVNFGVGAVARLGERLVEQRKAQQDTSTTAMVLSHKTEISDWMEEKTGTRIDGQMTKWEREAHERHEKRMAERKASKAAAEAAGNMELHYAKYPYDRPRKAEPMTEAEIRRASKRQNARDDAWYRKQAKRDEAEYRRSMDPEYQRKQVQAATSRSIGRKAADRVNLQPFLGEGEQVKTAGALGA